MDDEPPLLAFSSEGCGCGGCPGGLGLLWSATAWRRCAVVPMVEISGAL